MRTLLACLLVAPLFACGREAPPATTTASSAPAASSAAAPQATPTAPAVANADALVGKPAPEIVTTAHDGKAINTNALKGKHVVLYFYPRDETPGCTKEACAFRDAWKDLEATGVVLVGVSTDDADTHKKFAEHHKLPFHLITDKDGAIAKAYGVPNHDGALGRQTFVIGPDGNVKKVYRKVDVSKHASEILADVKS
jgi:thioredoxin-dependent peroxiredoxin